MTERTDDTTRRERRVAILGFAESYKDAPFGDPGVEIWGLNELYKYLPRWDRWFEVHDDATLGVTKRDASNAEVTRHLEWLAAQKPDRPIYMQPQFCDGRFPAAVPMPIEMLIARFGPYLTSTPAMMLALAIAEGFTRIGIYGIDLASDVEYEQQRPCMEYLIGLARGMGLAVEWPETSALCKAGHIYAFERPLADRDGISVSLLDARIKHLEERFAEAQVQQDKVHAVMSTIEGALQETKNWKRVLQFQERGVTVTF